MNKMLESVQSEIQAFEVYLALNGVSLWNFAQSWNYIKADVPNAVPLYEEVKNKFRELHPGCSIKLQFGGSPTEGKINCDNTFWVLTGSTKCPVEVRGAGNIVKLYVPVKSIA